MRLTSAGAQRRLIIVTIIFLLLPFQAIFAAQERAQSGPPAAQSTAKTGAANVLAASDEDYKIGPGDVIEVQVDDAPELSRTFRVNAKGTFLMPYLGRITAKERSPEELSNLISDGLRGRYLKDPKVSVVVKEYNSRSFFIQGAVKSPGVYQIEGRPSILKLITLAGGLNENHGSTAFIMREEKSGDDPEGASAEEGDYKLIQVNIDGLYKGRFDQNVTIEPNDIINIPTADVFFIAGEVRAPGSFPLKEGTTLRQAISLAQGTTFEAARDRGIIFRDDPVTGKPQEIKVDIAAVMNGKKEDIALKANDVVIIPNSRLKSVGGALLRAFGMATINRGVPVR